MFFFEILLRKYLNMFESLNDVLYKKHKISKFENRDQISLLFTRNISSRRNIIQIL